MKRAFHLSYLFLILINISCQNNSSKSIGETTDITKTTKRVDSIIPNNNPIEKDSIKNEKRNGLIYSYYENEKILSVSKYENDSLIWTGYPFANEKFLVPIKPFSIERDSIYIQAPYENGNTWYEGNFCLMYSSINKRNLTYAYGIHKIYYKNGKLKGIVDYDNKNIEKLDTNGKSLFKAKFDEYEIHKQTIGRY